MNAQKSDGYDELFREIDRLKDDAFVIGWRKIFHDNEVGIRHMWFMLAEAAIGKEYMGATKAQKSDGYGSPLVVIDANTKQPMSGVLIMFPEIDKAAWKALQTYVAERNMTDDAKFMDWFRAIESLWNDAKDAKGWGVE